MEKISYRDEGTGPLMLTERGITIQEMRAFVLVANLQSFTRAAEVLLLTQPGLSMAIRQLEGKLGAPLFDRARKAVQLSSVGAALLPSAERLVENFERTVAGMVEVSEGKTGLVTIACPEGVAAQVIAPALKSFINAYPGVAVSVFDGDATSVERMMHAHIADVGLMNRPGFAGDPNS
ncbi:LysR family transcriptional regulator [Shinella daejeonensis]|nr:LysR family transcriptional regulator [Shinella daejeonensis]